MDNNPVKPLSTAEKIAEEVFRCIEREKRIIKADLVEAVEKILRLAQPAPAMVVPAGTHKLMIADGTGQPMLPGCIWTAFADNEALGDVDDVLMFAVDNGIANS